MKTTQLLLLTVTAALAGMMLSSSAQEVATNAPATTPPVLAAATNQIALTVVKVDSEETVGENGQGTNAVDGNPDTFWHTQWQDASPEHPHEITIELTPPSTIKGFTYLPRQDDSDNGSIKDYEFYVSDDGQDFGQPVSKGAFEASKEKKTVTFNPVKCRFIKLKALSEVNGEAWTSAAEIGVVPND
jgi:phospholipase C